MQAGKWKSPVWSDQERKWVLEKLLGRGFDPTIVLSSDQLQKLESWSLRRAGGEPFSYVIESQEFRGNDYRVTPAVLIPRFETEGLVELALSMLGSRIECGAEVGIGSGVISIEFLQRHPQLKMVATDASHDAIAIAKFNAKKILGSEWVDRLTILGVQPDQVLAGVANSWLVQGALDFVISNPPYLLNASETAGDVAKYEPASALFAPVADVLFFYRRMSTEALPLLKSRGQIFLELPHERAESIRELFAQDCWGEVAIHDDLNGRARYLSAVKKVRENE